MEANLSMDKWKDFQAKLESLLREGKERIRWDEIKIPKLLFLFFCMVRLFPNYQPIWE